LVASGAAALLLILGLRWRFSRWLKEQRATRRYLRTVVLVGTDGEAVAISRMLRDEPELGYRVGAVVGESCEDPNWSELPHSPNVADLVGLARQVGASGVMIVDASLRLRDAAVALQAALDAGLHVQLWPAVPGVISRRVRFAPISGLPVLYVERSRPAAWQLALKRLMDVVVAVVLFPLVAPILLAAAIAIRLEDGGRVLYRHAVVGRDGRPIEVLKLRTMVPNAAALLDDLTSLNERRGGPLFKASNDPRVTRVGRLLRATSIDELPQLWDVLAGRMSLVGPRFSLPHEAAQFDEDHLRRTRMRPGMTGLWQTEARDNPSFSAYRRLDLMYVDNWSLGLDVAILANTAYAVVVRAAGVIRPRSAPSGGDPIELTTPLVPGSGVDVC
jgi:exopolysaccharide biosynthesis polyprenyl glycosylphosphotransferase